MELVTGEILLEKRFIGVRINNSWIAQDDFMKLTRKDGIL